MRHVFDRSIEFLRKGQSAEAFKEIDAGIASAEKDNRIDWIVMLGVYASRAAHGMGDFRLVVRYSERVLACDPARNESRALAFYALADAMFRLGEPEQAKKHAGKSYMLVQHPKNKTESDLLKLLMDRWPEIGEW
jgi:hypothetical protein